MSFESRGLPVTVCAPDTTQLFEPSGSGCSRKKGSSHGLRSAENGARMNVDDATDRDGAAVWPGGGPSNGGDETVGGWSRHEVFTYRSAVSSGPSLAKTFSRVSAAMGLVLRVSTIW